MKKFFLLVFLFPIFLLGSVSVTVNGSSYTIPQTNERGWGTAVTSWIQAISANTIQPTGGVFTLTNDLDLGATFGIKTNYVKSRNSNISSTGLIRLNNTDFLGWRNFANSGDLTLSVNTSNALLFNSIALADISTAQTLTNKTLAFASNTLTGVASTSTAQVITLKDIDGGTASNTSRITLPAAAKTSLDALTRKAGTIVYDTTSSKPYYDDGSTLKAIGSSSGATNYLTLGDAEGGTTGIVVSKNTSAAARPDTGFATGATNITLTTSATAPLSGVNSFILTKDAASRQGEQVYFPFTIDSRDKAKVLQISLDYIVNSGTFVAGSSSADSDLIAYIYDVTNGVFIEPSSFKFLSNSSTIADKFIANFQTSSNSTSYRLILHVASTSTAAYSLKFEGSVSPSAYVYGTPITDWVAYTPTFTAMGTVTGSNFVSRRVGDSLQVRGRFTMGTGTGSQAQMTLGYAGASANVVIDSVKLSNIQKVGDAGYSAAFARTMFIVGEPSTNYVTFSAQSSGIFAQLSGSSLASSSETISLDAQVPITGWSSSVQQSDSYSSRDVAFSVNTTSTAATTSTPFIYTNVLQNTTGSYNAATGVFTAPTQGTYTFVATAYNAAAHTIAIHKNGTSITQGAVQGSAANSSQVNWNGPLNAGDTIEVRPTANVTATSSATLNMFSGFKNQAPTTISATERVSFSATTSTTAGGTGTPLVFTVAADNSHGAYSTSTGRFTAPYSGFYCFGSGTYYAGTTTPGIYKNGTIAAEGMQATASTVGRVQHCMNLIAGDLVDVRPNSAATASGTAVQNTFYGNLVK